MKSMLHEASTVAKAIEKAWADSGRPLEFTINVLEVGQKNFLGFTKHPAVVSITYDPKRQAVKPVERKSSAHVVQKPMRQQPASKARPDQKVELRPKRAEFKAPKEVQEAPRPQKAYEETGQQDAFWTAELMSDAKVIFNEMLEKLQMNIPFEFKADQRMLRIVLDKNILPSAEDERHLYVGMSYLLIQFLKKKHKKKLRGYHLVISSKNHATPAQKPSSSNS